MSYYFLAILVTSFVCTVGLTPFVRAIAVRFGITDQPDRRRKLHKRIVARAGGSAVLGAVLLVCGLGVLFFPIELSEIEPGQIQVFGMLLAVMVGVWLLGLADDIWTLRGRQKLLGQIVLGAALVSSGFQIQNVSVFGVPVALGFLAVPVSLIWLLATTNALNLIDGSDGLCSTLGAIICGSLGILASVNGHVAESVVAFSMCGALLGFLVFNFPPATIFLGDSGSLLIGMVTGALAIRCSLEGATTVAMLAPVAILSLPLLDSLMAILRRKLTGRSIYATDRAHIHHSLKGKGLSDKGLLLVVACLALVTAAGALIGAKYNQEWLALGTVAAVFVLLIVTKAFGYSEMALLARRGSHFAMRFMQRVEKDVAQQRAVRLQGDLEWETIWERLVQFAEEEQLSRLHMDLNVPWLEEGFHGAWQKSRMPDKSERWTAMLPIFGDGQIAGRIEVMGLAKSEQSLEQMNRLTALIEDITPRIAHILSVGKRPLERAVEIPTQAEEARQSEFAAELPVA